MYGWARDPGHGYDVWHTGRSRDRTLAARLPSPGTCRGSCSRCCPWKMNAAVASRGKGVAGVDPRPV